MLTYSRSKGLFAGIDLGGSWVERDKDTMAALYGKDLTNTEVLTGKITPPSEARAFLAQVNRVKSEARQ
jgi:lipid-binding SYLF domain-containing protein